MAGQFAVKDLIQVYIECHPLDILECELYIHDVFFHGSNLTYTMFTGCGHSRNVCPTGG